MAPNDDEITLGLGQLLGGGPVDVAGPHRPDHPNLRRATADEVAQSSVATVSALLAGRLGAGRGLASITRLG